MSSQGAAPARAVVIYHNGDCFFPGRRFLLTPRRFPTFEAFLDEVTRSLHTPVRPVRGSRDREAQKSWKTSSCCSRSYLNQGRKEPRGTKSEGLQVSGMCLAVLPISQSCGNTDHCHALGCSSCSVFRNGDLLSPPFPLVLPQRTSLEWDTFLATLTEKVDLSSGAVHKLCRLDGTPVSRGEELVDGHHYVAVGKEEYKHLPYWELLVPQDSVRRTLGYV
ncbi:DCD2B protein, partial [Serilophus lunatus]|nr:DCD2B protein [Serilophus lunatus]